jgi:hypothetical protein
MRSASNSWRSSSRPTRGSGTKISESERSFQLAAIGFQPGEWGSRKLIADR